MLDIEDKLVLLAREVSRLKELTSSLKEATATITKLQGPEGIQGPKGEQGDRGFDGADGRHGADGQDGKDGEKGSDGISVVNASVDFDNSLVLKLSDGTEIDAGTIEVQAPAQQIGQLVQGYTGPKIYVQSTEPVGASIGDVWYQIT